MELLGEGGVEASRLTVDILEIFAKRDVQIFVGVEGSWNREFNQQTRVHVRIQVEVLQLGYGNRFRSVVARRD